MDWFKSEREIQNENLAAAGVYLVGAGILAAGIALVAAVSETASSTTTVRVDYGAVNRAERARLVAEETARAERLARIRAESAARMAESEAAYQRRMRALRV